MNTHTPPQAPVVPILIKISGANLDDAQFLDTLAGVIANSQVPIILVHGGGKEITALQEQMQIQAHYIDGLRVTDEASLQITLMVLCGTVNTRIVATLQRHGLEAQGLNGLDRGFIRARKIQHPTTDLGRVGKPYAVRGEIVHTLLNENVIPVIAPICLGEDGNAYNVNADHVTGAVASAVGVDKVYFITNVAGVMDGEEVLPMITPAYAQHLIDTHVIYGGMIPKIQTALALVADGVNQVVITNLEGILSGVGTVVTQDDILAEAV